MPQHEIVPFKARHITMLVGVERPSLITEDEVNILTSNGQAWTVHMEGIPIACGGYLMIEDGVAHLWSDICPGVGASGMLAATRYAMAVIEQLIAEDVVRIEMAVKTGFKAGHRWARMLGFHCESMKKSYYLDEDYSIYARIEE